MANQNQAKPNGVLSYWTRIPLALRIIIAIVLGTIAGLIWKQDVAGWDKPAKMIVDVIKVLAMPLIFLAIVHVLMASKVTGKQVGKLTRLLVVNTCVAIAIGLLLANVIQPGKHAGSAGNPPAAGANPKTLGGLLEDAIPKSILGPLTDSGSGKTLSIIVLSIAVGLAFRKLRDEVAFAHVEATVKFLLDGFIVMLKWVVELLPLAVLGLIASKVGTNQADKFVALIWFVVTVCLGLALQSCWYLMRIRACSWAKPMEVLRTCRDALLTAFSTASSTATMPVTYNRLKEKLGVREESANLGSLVGTNFNNDGTALYEAVAALFVAQMVGHHLGLGDQMVVVLTSMLAAMGAAGIPEGGAATLALVLSSVGLPVEYVPFLLTVDWFVDRCRTMVNVLGDINVSCILDGKVRASATETN